MTLYISTSLYIIPPNPPTIEMNNMDKKISKKNSYKDISQGNWRKWLGRKYGYMDESQNEPIEMNNMEFNIRLWKKIPPEIRA